LVCLWGGRELLYIATVERQGFTFQFLQYLNVSIFLRVWKPTFHNILVNSWGDYDRVDVYTSKLSGSHHGFYTSMYAQQSRIRTRTM